MRNRGNTPGLLFLALVLSTASCTTEIVVNETELPCTTTVECPGILSCDTDRGVCVLPATNRSPAVIVDDVTINEGEELVISVRVADDDGDAVTVTAELPERMAGSFDAEANTLRWQSGLTDGGTYELVFIAEDNGEPPLTARDTIEVTILETNAAPVITTIDTVDVSEDGPCELRFDPDAPRVIVVAASDIDPGDGDDFSWRALEQPAGADFDEATHQLSWTPTLQAVGTHLFRVRVRDPDGAEDQASCTLIVNPVNLPPVARVTSQVVGFEGATISLVATATDANPDDELTYRWETGDGAEALSGQSVEHVYADNGSYRATVTVTDAAGASDSETVAVIVTNRAPEPSAEGSGSPAEGELFTLSVTANDPGTLDTHTVDVDWDADSFFDVSDVPLLPDGAPLQHRFEDDGRFDVSVRVADNDGARGTVAIAVEVLNAAPEPTLTADGVPIPGASVTLAAAANDPGEADTHEYAFDLDGDGSFEVNRGSRSSITTSYAEAGEYTVGVRVTDDDGGSASTTLTLRVEAPTWVPLDLAAAPSTRSGATLTHETGSGAAARAWLYGGEDDEANSLSDLWLFELAPGDESALQRPGGSARPRDASGHVAVWDDNRDRLILAMGDEGGDIHTMTPDGATQVWAALGPDEEGSPDRFSEAAAVWLGADRSELLVFGGVRDAVLSPETWSLEIGASEPVLWRSITTDDTPRAARGRSAIFDDGEETLWLLGGTELDAEGAAIAPIGSVLRASVIGNAAPSAWVRFDEFPDQTSPAPRSGAGAVLDGNDDRIYWFGGRLDGGDLSAELWSLDIEVDPPVWSAVTTQNAPPARAGAGVIFDPHWRRLVVAYGEGEIGPLNDVWVLPLSAGARQVEIDGGVVVIGEDSEGGAADEQPEARVTLDAFRIDRSEVTNADYRRCVGAGICTTPSSFGLPGRADYFTDAAFDAHPVVNVSWPQAAAYCAWTGRRLPTEAEWERAARGPAGTNCRNATSLLADDGSCNERPYPWGPTADCERANIARGGDCSGADAGTLAVRATREDVSPEGVLNAAGNVREWVADRYLEGYYASAPASGRPGPTEVEAEANAERVVRGGSHLSSFSEGRVSARGHLDPESSAVDLGFRCAGNAP